MCLTNAIVFLLINVFRQINYASSACNYIPLAAQKHYVECTNVRSMHDLAAEMRSNWYHLKIVNNVDAVFTITGACVTECGLPSMEKIVEN